MPKIRMIVIEGEMTVEEVAGLTRAIGAAEPIVLPKAASGQEAIIRRPEPKAEPAPVEVPAPAPVEEAKPVKARKATPTPAPAPVPTPSEVIQQTIALDVEPVPETPAAPQPAPVEVKAAPWEAPPPPGSLSADVLTSLAGAKKLRDVIELMRGAGLQTLGEIVTEAKALRDVVPLLTRIDPEQVEDRVRRTFEAMA